MCSFHATPSVPAILKVCVEKRSDGLEKEAMRFLKKRMRRDWKTLEDEMRRDDGETPQKRAKGSQKGNGTKSSYTMSDFQEYFLSKMIGKRISVSYSPQEELLIPKIPLHPEEAVVVPQSPQGPHQQHPVHPIPKTRSHSLKTIITEETSLTGKVHPIQIHQKSADGPTSESLSQLCRKVRETLPEELESGVVAVAPFAKDIGSIREIEDKMPSMDHEQVSKLFFESRKRGGENNNFFMHRFFRS